VASLTGSAKVAANARSGWACTVANVPCPSLVIYGDDFREERGRQIARLYDSREHDFTGVTHWDLVRESQVREAIREFLAHAA
jgi:hypothetical protein